MGLNQVDGSRFRRIRLVTEAAFDGAWGHRSVARGEGGEEVGSFPLRVVGCFARGDRRVCVHRIEGVWKVVRIPNALHSGAFCAIRPVLSGSKGGGGGHTKDL